MSKSHLPSITVVIPTLNAMNWFKDSWNSFTSQDYEGTYEVLIIDSGSTDDTIEYCRSNSSHVRVITINPTEFGHGRTRNLALAHTDSELLIFTVQDACPPSKLWAARMVEDLVTNDLAALCGGQATPHHADKNPVEWYRPLDNNAPTLVIDGVELCTISNQELFQYCGWDNVNAIYRRSALSALPFSEVPFGEDMKWAKDALVNEQRIGYSYNNRMWHYHHRDFRFAYKRAAYDAYWRYKNFGVQPKAVKKKTVVEWIRMLHTIAIKSRITDPTIIGYWVRYNHRLNVATRSALQDFMVALRKDERHLYQWYINLGERSPIHSKFQ